MSDGRSARGTTRWSPERSCPHNTSSPSPGRTRKSCFVQHARQLHAVVSATVRTSAANIDDACGFAWLQLVRHRPPAAIAFAWLHTTAVREALKLQHRTGRLIDLDQLAEVAADPMIRPERSLELIATGEQIRAARLQAREARVLGLLVLATGATRSPSSPATPAAPSIASWGGRGESCVMRFGPGRR